MTATVPTFDLPGVSFPSPNTGRHLAPDYPLLTAHSLPQLGSEFGLPAGVATRAGRFFYEPPGHSQLLPFAPPQYFVVWVEHSESGFTLLDQQISIAELAERIGACREWQARPVVLAGTGDPAELRTCLPELAIALGAPVIASDEPISLIAGRVLTAGQFLECRPIDIGFSGKGNGEPELVAIGSELPPPVSVSVPDVALVARPDAALGARSVLDDGGADDLVEAVIEPEPLAVVEPELVDEPSPDAFAVSVELVAVPAIVLPPMVTAIVRSPGLETAPELTKPGQASGIAEYLTVSANIGPEHRDVLRHLLDWRYEAHSRGVTRVLALNPGLRSDADTEDALAALIGARAYLTDHSDRIDDYLRSSSASSELAALASCALAGLVRLPAFLGAVYRSGQYGAVVARTLQTGMEIVEPGFLRTSAHPEETADADVQYAIWGATARRTDSLGLDRDELVFTAGTRFTVLEVQPGEVTTVYLREVVRSDPKLDARALARLRAALDSAPRLAGGVLLSRPLGITQDGRQFGRSDNENLDGANR